MAKYITAVHNWRALTVDYPDASPVVLIFIIEDYEAFFRDPINNGVYKLVDRDLLERNWIDREKLIFTWQRVDYSNLSSDEEPIIGSHTEVTGVLEEIVDYLEANAP